MTRPGCRPTQTRAPHTVCGALAISAGRSRVPSVGSSWSVHTDSPDLAHGSPASSAAAGLPTVDRPSVAHRHDGHCNDETVVWTRGDHRVRLEWLRVDDGAVGF